MKLPMHWLPTVPARETGQGATPSRESFRQRGNAQSQHLL